MGRIRIFHFQCQGSVRDVAAGLTRYKLSRDRSDGFLVHRLTGHQVVGEYVERVEYVETVDDPFDGEVEVSRVDVSRFSFTIDSTRGWLLLHDCPRSLKSFINRLGAALDFKAVITSASIDLVAWLESYERVEGSLVLLEVLTDDLSDQADTLVKVLIASSGDVRKKLATFTGNRTTKLDRIKVRLPGVRRQTLELRRSGTIHVPHEIAEADLGEVLSAIKLL